MNIDRAIELFNTGIIPANELEGIAALNKVVIIYKAQNTASLL